MWGIESASPDNHWLLDPVSLLGKSGVAIRKEELKDVKGTGAENGVSDPGGPSWGWDSRQMSRGLGLCKAEVIIAFGHLSLNPFLEKLTYLSDAPEKTREEFSLCRAGVTRGAEIPGLRLWKLEDPVEMGKHPGLVPSGTVLGDRRHQNLGSVGLWGLRTPTSTDMPRHQEADNILP